MTEEEIEKEAKEYAQGNFYSEQGFLYGYERGFTEATTFEGMALRKAILSVEKENTELRAQNEKLKCCGNCKNRGLEKYTCFPCDRCRRWHRNETYNDYWELAE